MGLSPLSRKVDELMMSAKGRVLSTVVVAGLVLAGCSSGDGEQLAQVESQGATGAVAEGSSESSESAGESSGYVTSIAEGEKDRRWPRKYFDDSKYRPGTWAATAAGVPIYTPRNPEGEPLGAATDRDEVSDCRPDAVRAPEKVNVQYLHGRFLAFSPTDGPDQVGEDGLLTGYAKTPAGAALAVYNTVNYVTVSNDERGQSAIKKLIKGAKYDGYINSESFMLPPSHPMEAFKVQNCAGNMVTISLAFPQPMDDEGNLSDKPLWNATMSEAYWEDGQWYLRMTDQENVYGEDATIDSIDGWTRLEYQ